MCDLTIQYYVWKVWKGLESLEEIEKRGDLEASEGLRSLECPEAWSTVKCLGDLQDVRLIADYEKSRGFHGSSVSDGSGF